MLTPMVTTCCSADLPHSEADLRSSFLVVLDWQQRVMSLSGIAALTGDVCQ